MKITKKRLKAIILEEIKARKAEIKAENRQIQAEIQVKIAHSEGPCGDHECTACAAMEPEMVDITDFDPVFEEET